MQKTITNLPIKAICSTTTGATICTPVMITGSYFHTETNGRYSWYRKYSDGRIEQGGYIPVSDLRLQTGSNRPTSVHNLITPFTDPTTASVFLTAYSLGSVSKKRAGIQIVTITETTFSLYYDSENIDLIDGAYWEATGV